jgi:prephenate dehydrogenase
MAEGDFPDGFERERDGAIALSDCTLTIVGVGLMGGSLAGALRGTCGRVIGVDRDTETLIEARERGLIDEGFADLAKGVRNADVVVLATPVRSILQLLEVIGPMLAPDSLLMDLGSTKQRILRKMKHLPPHVDAIGAHPMCGKETSGVSAAERDLYRGRTFILSPLPRTRASGVATAKALARAAGATPLIIEGGRQDFLVGTISHLPYLLACSLVKTADTMTSPDPLVWDIVAGGYRDTSRVAGSDVTMMLDILMTNRENVAEAASTFVEHLQRLVQLIEAGDEEALRASLTTIRDLRKEMYP